MLKYRSIICVLLLIGTFTFAESRSICPFEIPVVVVSYFPTNGPMVDISITGDWGSTLLETKAKTERQTRELIAALEEGSRYHAYRNPDAKPSLKYLLLTTFEFNEPVPVCSRKSGQNVPMTDYNAIMKRIDIRHLVEECGVKEVWIWGYDGGKVGLWESNMAGPFGDISNSNRDPTDLPVLKSTYTVYNYNYQRGTSEACEDHMHQIEHVLNYVDGRDNTPPEKWDKLLFWGKFVGSDKSHKIVHPGCGWAHFPPNAENSYDWANPRFVETDIEDWKPDGSGHKRQLNCERWQKDSLKWFVYWMQSVPGASNGLRYGDWPLCNWWLFIGDFDKAMTQNKRLVEVGAYSNCATAGTNNLKSVEFVVDSKSNEGTFIGGFEEGDMISIEYIDGKWTPGALKDAPLESPDVELPEKASLRDLYGCGLFVKEGQDRRPLIRIPYGTEDHPFIYTFSETCEACLVSIDFDGKYKTDNSGKVTYRVTKNTAQ